MSKSDAKEIDVISQGILRAQALYAKYLGQQSAHSNLEKESNDRVGEAQKEFERVRAAEGENVKRSKETVEAAKQALLDHQAQLTAETGAVVDLLRPASTGGRVNL